MRRVAWYLAAWAIAMAWCFGVAWILDIPPQGFSSYRLMGLIALSWTAVACLVVSVNQAHKS